MTTTTQGASAEQYRKKPVVIEAIQWPGTKFEITPPQWFRDALYAEPGAPGFVMRIGDRIVIETLEGQVWAQPGDWIIRGVKGELYPCKPDIFAATYEPAALVAQPAAPVVPEGYVLVPKTMTIEMHIAFAEVWFSKVRPIDDHDMQDAYDAMLDAAPPAEVAPQAEQVANAEIHTLRRLIECAEILDKRPRPMCRDCADECGTCPTSGLDCDMRALIASAKALHNKLAAPTERAAAPADLFEKIAMLGGCVKQGIIGDDTFIERVQALLATRTAEGGAA